MRAKHRFWLPALLLCAAGAGVALALPGGEEAPPPAPPPVADGGQAPADAGPLAGDTGFERVDAGEIERSRQPSAPADRSGSEAAQGVRGIVVGPGGQPLPDLPVYLLESVQNNPFARWQALQHGMQFPPAAQGRTAADGSFSLGIQAGVDKLYELRVLSDVFADHTVPDIRIQAGDWYDLGRVVLRRGSLLRGRVTIEGTQLPAPGARVTVHSPNSFDDISLFGLPGREEGLGADVDANGYYSIANAPASGIVHLSAVAPGFARVTQSNVRIGEGGVQQVDFQLPRGFSIQGVVTDTAGAPVADAVVVASAVSSEHPQSERAFADRSGQFEIQGLREGLYQLRAAAPEHQARTEQGIAAGTRGLRLILERKGSARLRVLDDRGGYLDRYTLNVRRYFPQNGGHIGTVANAPERTVRAADLVDHLLTVDGLDDGLYVFQVAAEGYAKTLSEPFEIGAGEAPVVEVRMTRGTTLVGEVTDRAGRPVPGAVVRTQADGLVDNPFFRMVASMVPDKVTATETRTDAAGRFRLPHLAFGDYQLVVSHPDFCEQVVPGLQLRAAGERAVAPIRLARGALVHGIATINGRPAGQVRVVVATPAEQPAESTRPFHAEAVSDNSGRYVIPQRVPPGTYEIKAAQQTGSGIFVQVLQHRQTAHTFAVTAGQEEFEYNINIVVDR